MSFNSDHPAAPSHTPALLGPFGFHHHLIPLSLYILATLVAAAFGWFRLEVPHEFWHFLPLQPLLERPFQSLLYLHAQPPLLNVLYWLIHAAPGGPRLWGTTLFLLAGGVAACAWYYVAHRIFTSRTAAAILLVVLLANPAWWVFQTMLFYPHLLLGLFGLLAVMLPRFAEQPNLKRALAVVGLFVVIIYLRALWHPLLLVPLCGALAVYMALRNYECRSIRKVAQYFAILLGLGFALVLPWMTKNAALFGSPSFSTWTSINLRLTEDNPLWVFVQSGGTQFNPADVEKYYSSERIDKLSLVGAVSSPRRQIPDGRVIANMNYLGVPALNAVGNAENAAILRYESYRLVDRAKYFLRQADMPPYASPYSLDPHTGAYELGIAGWYPALWDRWMHGAWLREWIHLPLDFHGWRPSLTGLLAPFAIIFAAAWGIRHRRRPEGWLMLMLGAAQLWFLAMILLVDGFESCRMRWHLEPILLLQFGILIRGLWRARNSVRFEVAQAVTRMRKHPIIPAAAISVLAFLVYTTSPVNQATADSRYTILLSETLIHKQTFRLDASFQEPLDPARYASINESGLPYQVLRSGDGIYLGYPVGSSVLSIPLVAALNLLGVRTHNAEWLYNPIADEFAQRLLAALLCATTIFILMRMALRRLPLGWAAILTLGLAFGTMFWSTASRALWNDCWGMLLVTLVLDRLLASRESPLSMGTAVWIATLMAWSYIVRPTYAIPCVAITALMLHSQRKQFIPFAITATAWAFLFFLWSKLTFGSWLPPYYQQGNRLIIEGISSGLAGILISPSRGLLVFMPTLLWLIAVYTISRRQIADKPLLVTSCCIIVLMLLLNATWPIWWGGYSYGPRILTGLLPWLALLFVIGIAAFQASSIPLITRRITCIFGIFLLLISMAIHGRGALDRATWRWNEVPISVDEDRDRLWSWTHSQPLTGLFPPPLPKDGRINMGSSSADPFLVEGWADPEGSHRWNNGNTAALSWFGDSSGQPDMLVIDGFPFRSDYTPEAPKVRVSFNGELLTETAFSGELRVPLPPDNHRLYNRLTFEFPDAASPASLGLGDDARMLSVGIRVIRLESPN